MAVSDTAGDFCCWAKEEHNYGAGQKTQINFLVNPVHLSMMYGAGGCPNPQRSWVTKDLKAWSCMCRVHKTQGGNADAQPISCLLGHIFLTKVMVLKHSGSSLNIRVEASLHSYIKSKSHFLATASFILLLSLWATLKVHLSPFLCNKFLDILK